MVRCRCHLQANIGDLPRRLEAAGPQGTTHCRQLAAEAMGGQMKADAGYVTDGIERERREDLRN
jgi:hypothetical protein